VRSYPAAYILGRSYSSLGNGYKYMDFEKLNIWLELNTHEFQKLSKPLKLQAVVCMYI